MITYSKMLLGKIGKFSQIHWKFCRTCESQSNEEISGMELLQIIKNCLDNIFNSNLFLKFVSYLYTNQ